MRAGSDVPRTPADAADETAREIFPEIKYPYETAVAEVDKAAKLMADRGLEPGGAWTAEGSRPTGEPLAARDVAPWAPQPPLRHCRRAPRR